MEGRWAEAVEMFDKALEIARTNRTVLWAEPYTMSDLAECYVALGRNDEAVDMAKRALAQAMRLAIAGCESNAMLALARVELAVEGAGAIEEAEGLLAKGDGPDAHDGNDDLRSASLARARADRAPAGRLREVRRELSEAHRLFTEIGADGHARASRKPSAAASKKGSDNFSRDNGPRGTKSCLTPFSR